MRRLAIIFLAISFVLIPTALAAGITTDKLTVDVYVSPSSNVYMTNAVFELYSEDYRLLGTQSFTVTHSNHTYKLNFPLEPYPTGTKFRLKLKKGLVNMQFYQSTVGEGQDVLMETYDYVPQGSSQTVIGNSFQVICRPYPEQVITAYVNGNYFPLQYPIKRSESGELMGEVNDILNMFRISQYDYTLGDGAFTVDHDGRKTVFNFGSYKMSVNGDEWTCYSLPRMIEGRYYVPIDMMAHIYDAELKRTHSGDALNVNINLRKSARLENRVNSEGISSRTNYLIWVNKGEYRLNVFTGSRGNWKHENSYKCTIGADATPTVTGQFEFYGTEKSWNYPNYYVGPVMRFYQNYAIHSTKIRYDGSFYDNRVEKKLSLGCVRLRPAEINKLFGEIPLWTKIYITEN